jgi:hypothetical protein
MRRTTLISILLVILRTTTLEAQDNVSAALQERLVAFTDQLWAAWIRSGDIRSVSSMRVQEIMNDPPCALVLFTSEKTCQQINKEERADYVQTVDNALALMMYRLLSHQSVFDWMASTANSSSDSLDEIFKPASFSNDEMSLLKGLLGTVTDVDEFRRRIPQYKELEKMLQADHLKDFERAKGQYEQNMALVDQALKANVSVSRVDWTHVAPGLASGGEYFAVPKGLFIFFVHVAGDEMRMASLQMITK